MVVEDRAAVRSPRAYLSVDRDPAVHRPAAVDRGAEEDLYRPLAPRPGRRTGAGDPADGSRPPSRCRWRCSLVLESLSPVERAAYLLRRIFDYGYDEIGEILGKTEVNCRQLVSRAEEHIQRRRPRFEARPEEAERLTAAFLAACSSGDMQGLLDVLATGRGAVLRRRGQGRRGARADRGADRIARLFLGILKKAPAGLEIRKVRVNGQPGLLVLVDGQVIQVLTFDIVDGRIATCFVVRNPDKLARVEPIGD